MTAVKSKITVTIKSIEKKKRILKRRCDESYMYVNLICVVVHNVCIHIKR